MTDEQMLQAPRGTRDFMPQEKIKRDWIVGTIKREFEKFGFNPLETPALENFDVLSNKFAGGEEILKETYRLKDQGNRELGLRYDLTVPLCRIIASNNALAMPFKRYQIASAWRDGPLKTGRYREFTQCDADIVGVESLRADAECVALTQSVFDALGLKVKMRVNNRKFLDGLLAKAGVPESKRATVMLSIDKLEKIGRDGVERELKEKGVTVEILEVIKDAKPSREIGELFSYCEELGVRKDFVVFDASLARGLNYYTGTVFEGYLAGGKIKSSVCGGGRYDDLIAKFSGREQKIPAVGISFGVDVIAEVAAEREKTVVQAFLIPIKTTARAIAIAQELRAQGVNCAVDLMERSISKNLDYASKQGIPFAIIVGEQELKAGKIKLRDLQSGEEKLVSVSEAAEIIG